MCALAPTAHGDGGGLDGLLMMMMEIKGILRKKREKQQSEGPPQARRRRWSKIVDVESCSKVR